MWSRKTVKKYGKLAMRRNYWKTVLVSLILSVILGGASSASSAAGVSSGMMSGAASGTKAVKDAKASSLNQGTGGDIYEGVLDPGSDLYEGELQENAVTGGDLGSLQNADTEAGLELNGIQLLPEEMLQNLPGDPHILFDFQSLSRTDKLLILGIAGGIFLLLLVIVILISAFLLNPLELGVRRFFMMNMREPANIGEVAYGYDHSYKKNVKVLFLRDLFLVLWSLLFIIPGIIKTYSYRLVPYILADHPEMSRKEIFKLSRSLMNGNKWKAFVLDLSFIGWYILSIFTLGILQVFFVSPYKNMTDAALYQKLMYGQKTGEEVPVAAALPSAEEESLF